MKSGDKITRGVLVLALGSILGQVIGFAGSVVMTRLYSQASIGELTLVIAITGMFGPVINGKLDYAIVKEEDDDFVLPLMTLCLLLGAGFSAIVAICSFMYFATQEASLPPLALSLSVLAILAIISITNVFRSFNNRLEEYRTMSFVIVLRKLAEEGSKALFGLFGSGTCGLLVSRALGELFGMRQQAKSFRGQFGRLFHIDKDKTAKMFRKHNKQLFFSAPAALLNAAAYSLISIFFGSLFGLEELALYSISVSVLGLPLSVISGNFSKVFFKEASTEKQRLGTFRMSMIRMMKILFPLAVLVFIGMFWIAPPLVPILYGEAYAPAGEMIKILAPMFAVRFVTSAIAVGLTVADKQQLDVMLQGGFAASAAAIYAIGHTCQITEYSFLGAFSAAYAVVYFAYFIVVYIFSGNKTEIKR